MRPTRNPDHRPGARKGAEALGLNGDVTAEQFDCAAARSTRSPASLCEPSPPAADATTGGMGHHPLATKVDKHPGAGRRRYPAHRSRPPGRHCAPCRRPNAAPSRRQRGGREWVQTGNVWPSMFEHYDARESITGAARPDAPTAPSHLHRQPHPASPTANGAVSTPNRSTRRATSSMPST